MTLQPLSFAEAETVDVGQWVVAFGTALGARAGMNLGIVSAVDRNLTLGSESGYSLPDILQTSLFVTPGSAGGPLVNLNDEVVGVAVAPDAVTGGNPGIGLAILASIVQRIVPALIAEGRYPYPYLGISGSSVTPQLVETENLTLTVLGVWVNDVANDGPAAAAGIQVGDIITAVNDTPIHSFADLVSYLFHETEPDQQITVSVLRDDEEQTLTVTVGERPITPEITEERAPQQGSSEQTISVGDAITIAREMMLDGGLMDDVDSSSAELQQREEGPVWVVTLVGDGKNATVTVDAVSGEVVGMNVK